MKIREALGATTRTEAATIALRKHLLKILAGRATSAQPGLRRN